MKVKSIEIRNFRSIEFVAIDCLQFNSFVGPNGAGKSTVLNALNVFFGEVNSFSVDDFHSRNTKTPIVIRLTFHDLSEEAAEEFQHYVRAGQLVVQVEISANGDGSFTKVVRGERLIFEPFKSFFEVKSASDRKTIFNELRKQYPEIANATNDEGRKSSIAAYEETIDQAKKVLTVSGAEFFGVSKGAHKFQRHLSWVYVPAVKDAASESEEAKSSHLGRLIQHTIRSGMDYENDLENIRKKALEAYEALLTGQRDHLTKLQERLSARLREAVTSETDLTLDWKRDEKSVEVNDPVAQVLLYDRGFSGEVGKFGHGLQRSFLLVILQELIAVDNKVSPTLILGCEEPELYQHPPQAQHLSAVLMELSEADAQVFITTHSPYFIDVDHYEGIKMFRNSDGATSVSKSSFSTIQEGYNAAFSRPLHNEDQARTKLAIQMQPKFNEVFFADKVVLIEGISDQACIEAFLRLSERKSEFQKSGASMLVCEGKSSLALMLLIAKDFKIPCHIIFDCDGGSDERYHAEHINDNDAIFRLTGRAAIGALPTAHIIDVDLTAWEDNIETVLKDEFGDDTLRFNEAGSNAVGHLKNSKKNPLFVAAAMKAAWEAGRRFPVLDKVVTNIVEKKSSNCPTNVT